MFGRALITSDMTCMQFNLTQNPTFVWISYFWGVDEEKWLLTPCRALRVKAHSHLLIWTFMWSANEQYNTVIQRSGHDLPACKFLFSLTFWINLSFQLWWMGLKTVDIGDFESAIKEILYLQIFWNLFWTKVDHMMFWQKYWCAFIFWNSGVSF